MVGPIQTNPYQDKVSVCQEHLAPSIFTFHRSCTKGLAKYVRRLSAPPILAPTNTKSLMSRCSRSPTTSAAKVS